MQDYTKYKQQHSSVHRTVSKEYDLGLRDYMVRIFSLMTIALLISGLTSFSVATVPALFQMFFTINPANGAIGMNGLGAIASLAPIGIVFAMSFGLEKMSYSTLKSLFIGYSVLMGISLSTVLIVYTGQSVARVFFITASVFGAMSLYGYTTKKDLTSIGSFLIMGLIGVIVLSLVNMFLKSSAMQFALSLVSLVIFIGLTAYDTQKMKNIYLTNEGNTDILNKLSVMGALSLYMDFINIFIQLLRFFGERRDN